MVFQPHAEALDEQCPSLDGAKGGDKQVEQDINALKSPDLKARVEAADRLGGRCQRRSVPPLLTMLKEDKEPLGRAAAVKALGRLGDPDSIDPLREAIADPAWEVRLELGRALCSFQVHRASYDVLNQLVNPTVVAAGEAGDLYARCQGILAVNQLRDVNFSRKSVHFLFFFLDSPEVSDPSRKEMAIATLYELKKTRNGPHELVGILKQNLNPVYRIKAAEWLGRLGITSAEEALNEAAANDRDVRVRGAAVQALAQLKLESGK